MPPSPWTLRCSIPPFNHRFSIIATNAYPGSGPVRGKLKWDEFSSFQHDQFSINAPLGLILWWVHYILGTRQPGCALKFFCLFKELRWAALRCGGPRRKLNLCNIGRLETKAKQEAIKFYYSDGSSLYCAGSESFYWTQHPRLHRHAFNARVRFNLQHRESSRRWKGRINMAARVQGRAWGRVQRGRDPAGCFLWQHGGTRCI